MQGRVEGKTAIITGSASGIGRATAELLAAEGARVVIADLNQQGAEETAAAIRDRGHEALAVGTNVADEASIKAMVEQVTATFGAIQILHNNAAMTATHHHAQDADLLTMSVDYWDESFSVNLRGAMLTSKHVLPVMLDGGGGAIVNTSSNQSLAGDLSQFAYSAAKAGINALTRSIATTYGRRGVRCNTVSPGYIETRAASASVSEEMGSQIVSHNLIPRAGKATDLARAVLFLASDDAAFITGQLLSVDGGQLAHLPHYAYLHQSGAVTTDQSS